MIEWSGALRWLVATDRADAASIRTYASENGGHATLFRAADKRAGAFHPLPRRCSFSIAVSSRSSIRTAS
jgi:glycolate oxidase FAD binding subunit